MSTGVTDAGFALLAALTGNIASPTAATYIGVGTSGTAWAHDQTALVAETVGSGLDRVSVTATAQTTNVTGDTIQWQNTFSVTGNVTIAEAGILNAAYNTGSLLCRGVFSPTKSVTNGDTFTTTAKLVFS